MRDWIVPDTAFEMCVGVGVYDVPVEDFRTLQSQTVTVAMVDVDPAVRYMLVGKPQKWMHGRARAFRADRRAYRRWRKGRL